MSIIHATVTCKADERDDLFAKLREAGFIFDYIGTTVRIHGRDKDLIDIKTLEGIVSHYSHYDISFLNSIKRG